MAKYQPIIMTTTLRFLKYFQKRDRLRNVNDRSESTVFTTYDACLRDSFVFPPATILEVHCQSNGDIVPDETRRTKIIMVL
jgi:hypothetical protein